MPLLLDALLLADNYCDLRLCRFDFLNSSQYIHVELSPNDSLLYFLFPLRNEEKRITEDEDKQKKNDYEYVVHVLVDIETLLC